MTKLRSLACLVLLLTLLADSQGSKPNIVLLFADDVSATCKMILCEATRLTIVGYRTSYHNNIRRPSALKYRQ